MLGYHPQVILAGRRINDGMGKYIAEQTVKCMINAGQTVKGGDAVVLGLTFKEDCPDLRNSKVIDVIHELQTYGLTVHVHDPVACVDDARREYGIELVAWDDLPRAGAIVSAVSHRELLRRPIDQLLEKLLRGGVYADVKCTANRRELENRGARVWRL
jgi:UDP-N-acetyl-D-galactosamine dehydrogenase